LGLEKKFGNHPWVEPPVSRQIRPAEPQFLHPDLGEISGGRAKRRFWGVWGVHQEGGTRLVGHPTQHPRIGGVVLFGVGLREKTNIRWFGFVAFGPKVFGRLKGKRAGGGWQTKFSRAATKGFFWFLENHKKALVAGAHPFVGR